MLASYGILAGIALLLLQLPLAKPFEERYCDGRAYAANGTFQANLNLLAATLPGDASSAPTGFATNATGTAPDRAYGMALCRGDANASSCSACVATAFRGAGARENCPLNTGVTMYEDACVLRFSNVRFMDFLRADQWQVKELTTSFQLRQAFGNVTAVPPAWFSAAATAILTAVVDHALAASGNSTAKKYFAMGEVDFEPKIYGLAQCVPDMTPAQCQGCLGSLLELTTPYLSINPRWITSLLPWCNLRYSVRPFYEGRAMLQLPAPPAPVVVVPPSESGAVAGKKRSAAGISAGIACSVVLILVLSVFAFIRFRRSKATVDDHPLKKIVRAQCMIFDLPALQEATENFSEKNKLGEGGFGIVYKGILPDGQEIAVKKLLGSTGHGLHQLHNEVRLLAELQHKNLVRLQGFCSHRDDTLLVYEYMKNGSLDNFLFDTGDEGDKLIWEQQYDIILGIAKGILYLHEDSSMRIIHRDLKPNNILLDDDMDPKIADFGLARLLGEGHTHTKTAKAVGTLGYMPPEYAIHGHVSPKIDIFSFGVLVLEIVTRKRNCSSDDRDTVNLLSDVWNYWTKGTISQMIDQSLDEYARSQALRCIHIGLMCVQSDPDDRPYISSVIFMLTRDNTEIQAPAQPAFFFGRESALASRSYGRSDFILGEDVSVNGVTITELYPSLDQLITPSVP